MPHNIEEIIRAYVSKHNIKCENKVVLFVITNGKKWHDLAAKSFSALLSP